MERPLFLKKVSYKLLLLLPLILVVAILLVFLLDFLLSKEVSKNKINDLSFQSSEISDYPLLKKGVVPKITAGGAIVMDANSKVVLYSKNPDLRFSLASTTKMMTALTALDYFKLDDILTVRVATKEGSLLGLRTGEQMTFENLLYAMFLPSANDAAFTIAENYPGGVKAFVEKMNDKAKELKLYNTSYIDPAGLLDEGDYTTPFDLARLAAFVSENDTLKRIVSTKQRLITDVAGNQFNLNNLNQLLGFDGVNGIKTGTTAGAGEVLVTSKIKDGRTIIIVVMESKDRFEDTQKLLDLVTNLNYLPIHL